MINKKCLNCGKKHRKNATIIKCYKKFKDNVTWNCILKYQKLSEDFIREFKDSVDWNCISKHQHSYKKRNWKPIKLESYLKKHSLKSDKKYFYAFRNHDSIGNGRIKSNSFYTQGKYYTDWHCDLNPNNENSYGFGIYPKGNTPIKVKLSDWGTEVKNNQEGKARVWGFEII